MEKNSCLSHFDTPYTGNSVRIYTHHEMEDKNYFGIQGGLQQSFKLNDRWNIFAEEYLRGYNGKITPSARTYTSGEYTFVLGASIGTSYRF